MKTNQLFTYWVNKLGTAVIAREDPARLFAKYFRSITNISSCQEMKERRHQMWSLIFPSLPTPSPPTKSLLFPFPREIKALPIESSLLPNLSWSVDYSMANLYWKAIVHHVWGGHWKRPLEREECLGWGRSLINVKLQSIYNDDLS